MTTSPLLTQAAAPRRGRPVKPSAKATENRKNRKLYTAVLGTTEDDSAHECSSPASAELSSKLDILTRLVASLSETVTQQTAAAHEARAELREIKTEQQELKTLNTQLQEEVRTLQSKLDTYSASLPSTMYWTSIAAGQTTSQELAFRSTASHKAKKEPSYLRISTNARDKDGGFTNNGFARYLPTQTVNKYIRNAL